MRNCLEHARRALDAYERLIAKEQDIEHEELADATRRFVKLRDAMIAERRRGEGWGEKEQNSLDRINSILTVASSAEFPLVGVRWKRLCMLRDALRSLISEWESAPANIRREANAGLRNNGARQ